MSYDIAAKRVGFGLHGGTGLLLHETWEREDGSRFTLLFRDGKIVRAYDEPPEWPPNLTPGHVLECNGWFSIRSDDGRFFLYRDGEWKRPVLDGNLDRWKTRAEAEAFLKERTDAQDFTQKAEAKQGSPSVAGGPETPGRPVRVLPQADSS